MPGDGKGLYFAGKGLPQGEIDDGEPGLKRPGVLHLLLAAFPEYASQREAAHFLSLFPEFHGFGAGVRHVASHAGRLRALAGKEDGKFLHLCCLPWLRCFPVRESVFEP